MAINLQSLVEQGANVRIEITAADLKMFGEGITERAIMVYREEIESKKPQEETYYNTREVKELLNVCDGTLNLWAKRGYLVPSESLLSDCRAPLIFCKDTLFF